MKNELKVQAWVDGELTAAEARQMEQLAAADPEARALAEALRSVKLSLAGNEESPALPVTREFNWTQIERRILSEPAPESWFLRWRIVLAPLAGAALALGMFLFAMTRPAPAPAVDDDDIDFASSAPAGDFTSATAGVNTTTYQGAGMTVIWINDKNGELAGNGVVSQ